MFNKKIHNFGVSHCKNQILLWIVHSTMNVHWQNTESWFQLQVDDRELTLFQEVSGSRLVCQCYLYKLSVWALGWCLHRGSTTVTLCLHQLVLMALIKERKKSTTSLSANWSGEQLFYFIMKKYTLSFWRRNQAYHIPNNISASLFLSDFQTILNEHIWY